MGTMRLANLRIDPARNLIASDAASWSIEPKIMDLLVLLSAHPYEVMSREQLIEQVWKVEYGADESLTRAVSQLRKTFREAGATTELIETIPKRGYRLTVTPSALPADAVNPPMAERSDEAASATSQLAAEASMPSEAISAEQTSAIAAPVEPRRWKVRSAWLAAGFVILLAGVGGFVLAGEKSLGPEAASTAQAVDALTLAVMPFESLSTGVDDELLAKGMSREIRNTLSRVRGLKVLADASSVAAAAEKMSATELGEKKWADLVVNGSFNRDGDNVKLTAELVDAKTGLNVWAGDKSGPASDLNRVRELMSAALFQEIVARAGPDRLQQAASPPSVDPRAYRLTLEAYQIISTLASIQQRGAQEETLRAGDRADALLNEALAIEANNAEALMLKGILQLNGRTHAISESGATFQERLAGTADFYRRALAIDPDNAEALVNLAEHYRRNEWRWAEARPLFERALAVDPNNAYARGYWSNYLSAAGRCVEALEQARIVRELNPADSFSLSEARTLKCVGQAEASDAIYIRTLRADRANLFVLSEFYLALLARRDEKGLEALVGLTRDDLWNGQPSQPVAAWLTRISEAADALKGKPAAFVKRLDDELREFETPKPDLNGRRGSDRYWTFAIEYAHAGETSRAIDLLGRAIKEGSLYIPDTMPYGEWEFTPEMRKDPRYQALWKSDPRLVELVRLRREALEARQFTGFMPDGTRVEALFP